jgi:spore coat polysaccharide biosynthesis predicted glycosyltransferase SpsG
MTALKQRRWKILLIDDGVPLPHYPVDIILNQNQYVDESIYDDKTNAKLLLGTQYAVVQEEFFRTRSWRRDFPNIGSKLLITFGGADPNNNTMGIINSIIENCPGLLSEIDTRIIIAGTNKKKPSIENLVKYLKNIQVFSDVQNMADHIRWCDIAVSSAGYTVLEASLYQTPMILIPNSNNEKQLASKLNEIGASIVFMDLQGPNRHLIIKSICKLLKDGDKRKQLGKAAGRLVDGNGTSRVIEEMLNFNK